MNKNPNDYLPPEERNEDLDDYLTPEERIERLFRVCPQCRSMKITLIDQQEGEYQCENCNYEFSAYLIPDKTIWNLFERTVLKNIVCNSNQLSDFFAIECIQNS